MSVYRERLNPFTWCRLFRSPMKVKSNCVYLYLPDLHLFRLPSFILSFILSSIVSLYFLFRVLPLAWFSFFVSCLTYLFLPSGLLSFILCSSLPFLPFSSPFFTRFFVLGFPFSLLFQLTCSSLQFFILSFFVHFILFTFFHSFTYIPSFISIFILRPFCPTSLFFLPYLFLHIFSHSLLLYFNLSLFSFRPLFLSPSQTHFSSLKSSL